MQNCPLVTIIIPVYNVAPYLREALDSAVNQTNTNLEIIIIDDGSTDGSGKICDEYSSDARVTIIHQSNRGLSAARNTGLDLMTGQYVCFLDADDMFDLRFVESLMNIMEKENPDIAICSYSLWNRKEKSIQNLGFYDRNDALRELIEGRINSYVWNKLYRRELWKDIRFPNGHNYEDIDTMYLILNICSSVYITEQVLYRHRKRSGSITRTFSKENIMDQNQAYKHREAYIQDHIPEIFSSEQLERQRASRLVVMISHYLKYNGDKAFSTELRDEIITLEKQVGIKRFRPKVAFYMIRYYPWLLKAVYPAYRPIRLCIFNMTGK